jgi:VWFA-related protein
MNRQMLRLPAVTFMLSLLALPISAQSTGENTLQTNVNLVLVDVVVLDHGKHVHGLNKSAFHIFEDGKEQRVASFDEHQPDANPAPLPMPPTLPPHVVSNAPTYPPSDTVNVLLLDALNTPAADQQMLHKQMLAYLEQLPPGKTIAIFTLTSKLSQLQGFTADRRTLEKAIQSMKNGARASNELDGSDPYEAMQFDLVFSFGRLYSAADSAGYALDRRVEFTLDAFNRLAKYLSLLPGRKNLIWFSGSFPLVTLPDGGFNGILRSARNYSTQIDETAATLASARVSIYPVQLRGGQTQEAYSVTKNMTDDSSLYGTADMGAFAQDQTMQNLAKETGGVAYLHSNDLMASLRSALDDGEAYYTVGFTPSEKGKYNEYHKLKLVIDGADNYSIDYRRSYFKKQATELNTALNSATIPGAPQPADLQFIARALPADDPQFAGATLPQGPAGELAGSLKPPLRRYVFDLKVAPDKLTFSEPQTGTHHAEIEFVLVAYDADGKRVNFLDRGMNLNLNDDKFAALKSNGAPVRLALDLPAGKITMRLVVNDKLSSKLGAIELPLLVAAK